jgi:hypothetical protein
MRPLSRLLNLAENFITIRTQGMSSDAPREQ